MRRIDDRYYSPKEVAEMLKLNIHTIRDHIATGELPAYRIGKKIIRISGRDLRAFIERNDQHESV